MACMDVENIEEYLKKNLTRHRFKHCLNVAKACAKLARKFSMDPNRAFLAGLAHDSAKNKTDEEQIAFCKNGNSIEYFADIVKYAPQLLHSYNSATIAKDVFGIKDKEILKAIANHTLGDIDMSILEKIVYVGDALYPATVHDMTASIALRSLTRINFEGALRSIMRAKISYTLGKKEWVCPKSVEVWNFYVLKK